MRLLADIWRFTQQDNARAQYFIGMWLTLGVIVNEVPVQVLQLAAAAGNENAIQALKIPFGCLKKGILAKELRQSHRSCHLRPSTGKIQAQF